MFRHIIEHLFSLYNKFTPMEKGNSSNSNKIAREYWASFLHSTLNDQQKERGEWCATCQKCSQSFEYNVFEPYFDLPLRMHYHWHVSGADRPKRYDWSEYCTPPKRIPDQGTGIASIPYQLPFGLVEEIFKFRGDHTVSCKKCGEVFNYKENILRDHYDDHNRRDKEEKEARERETKRINDERRAEEFRQGLLRSAQEFRQKKLRELREEEAREKRQKEIDAYRRAYQRTLSRREEERRNAARCMAEVEKQEAEAAFWNEAAQMADNPATSQQQNKNDEDDEPWWDEILKYADSQNI